MRQERLLFGKKKKKEKKCVVCESRLTPGPGARWKECAPVNWGNQYCSLWNA